MDVLVKYVLAGLSRQPVVVVGGHVQVKRRVKKWYPVGAVEAAEQAGGGEEYADMIIFKVRMPSRRLGMRAIFL